MNFLFVIQKFYMIINNPIWSLWMRFLSPRAHLPALKIIASSLDPWKVLFWWWIVPIWLKTSPQYSEGLRFYLKEVLLISIADARVPVSERSCVRLQYKMKFSSKNINDLPLRSEFIKFPDRSWSCKFILQVWLLVFPIKPVLNRVYADNNVKVIIN